MIETAPSGPGVDRLIVAAAGLASIEPATGTTSAATQVDTASPIAPRMRPWR
jgi:hypothetical protein